LASAEKEITNWFYLTGGTALSEFYLQHRLSEDLDFFSESNINEAKIDKFISYASDKLGAKIVKETHMAILIYKLSFDKGEILKIDFANRPFKELETGTKFKNLKIASLWDIVVDKFYTILHRTTARDFIDLYFGIKEVGCDTQQLVSALNEKYEMDFGLISTGNRFLRVRDLFDFPKMLVSFDRQEMENFYVKLAKSLESKIFE
jgi:predicted nucleotidyltransferase component of viral defense system